MSDGGPLLNHYASRHPVSFARNLVGADSSEVMAVLGALEPALAVRVLVQLPIDIGEALVVAMPDATVIESLNIADDADVLRFLNRIAPDRRAVAVDLVEDDHRQRILRRALTIRPGSIGELLSTDAMCVRAEMSIGSLRELLRSRNLTAGELVIVLDESDRFLGFFDAGKALVAADIAAVGTCVVNAPVLHVDTTPNAAVRTMRASGRAVVPVVDREDRFAGLLDLAGVQPVHGSPGNADLGVATPIVGILETMLGDLGGGRQ